MLCHKETEQAQRARVLAQVEAWEGAAVVAAAEAVAVASALVETAFAQTVAKEFPTS